MKSRFVTQRCRRGIVVESRATRPPSSVGAAYSDAAPTGLMNRTGTLCYKDIAPTVLVAATRVIKSGGPAGPPYRPPLERRPGSLGSLPRVLRAAAYRLGWSRRQAKRGEISCVGSKWRLFPPGRDARLNGRQGCRFFSVLIRTGLYGLQNPSESLPTPCNQLASLEKFVIIREIRVKVVFLSVTICVHLWLKGSSGRNVAGCCTPVVPNVAP